MEFWWFYVSRKTAKVFKRPSRS